MSVKGFYFWHLKGKGQYFDIKVGGVAIFWAGCTRPPHHGLWGEGGCDSNSSLQLVRPLSHPAIPSHILYSCALCGLLCQLCQLKRGLPYQTLNLIQETLIAIMIPSMPGRTSFWDAWLFDPKSFVPPVTFSHCCYYIGQEKHKQGTSFPLHHVHVSVCPGWLA